MMNNRLITLKIYLQLTLLFGLLIAGNSFAADKYRVSARVYSLGELIGQPVMTVEEGQTSSGSYSVSGQPGYDFIVLIRPAADDEVSISLQFTSGKLTLQPNLLVVLNQQTELTIDKARMVLLVEREPDTMTASQRLTGTSWRVEDIAGDGIIDSSQTTIEFSNDGRVAGSTGCNRYFGGVEIAGANMSVGELAGTRMMCPPALMNQEKNFFQAMADVSSWEIDSTGILYLRDANGAGLIRASKAEDANKMNPGKVEPRDKPGVT